MNAGSMNVHEGGHYALRLRLEYLQQWAQFRLEHIELDGQGLPTIPGMPMEDSEFAALAMQAMRDKATQTAPREPLVPAHLMARLITALIQRPKASHGAWAVALVELKMMRGSDHIPPFNTLSAVRATLRRAVDQASYDNAFISALSVTLLHRPLGNFGSSLVVSALCWLSGTPVELSAGFSQEIQRRLEAHDRKLFLNISWARECLNEVRHAYPDTIIQLHRERLGVYPAPGRALGMWRERLREALKVWTTSEVVWPSRQMTELMKEVDALIVPTRTVVTR